MRSAPEKTLVSRCRRRWHLPCTWALRLPLWRSPMNRLMTWSHTSWLLLALLPACGSDGGAGATPSTSELVATCTKACNKQKDCLGEQGSLLRCDEICSPKQFQKPSGSTTVTCDYEKLRSKLEQCSSVECSALPACQEEASKLWTAPTPTGAGGSPSTGAGGVGAGGQPRPSPRARGA